MSRVLMGVIKDRHGTYCAQLKIPKRYQVAVAQVRGLGRDKQVYLKASLGTKDLKTANVRAKHVLAGFDRIIREAAALVARPSIPQPQRTKLNSVEIARMVEALYGKLLADDEAFRFGGRAFIADSVEWIRRNADADFELPYPIESVREYGWKPEQLAQQKEHLVHELATMQDALARGDITAVVDDVSLLLSDFQISLDRKSASYRELATLALQAYVRALQAIEKRNVGLPVETPKFSREALSAPALGGTLRDAFEGWQKERVRPAGTVHEYKRSVEMFIQLHDDLAVVEIKRSHARLYREAIQAVPKHRSKKLRTATLPELSAWGLKHPEAPRVSAATVNKQLGAVSAIASWARLNGIIPEDTPWPNPFDNMSVPEEQSERTSFENAELQLLFSAPVFTKHEYPEGGRGCAAFWLPMLALFTGARQGELTGLTAADVQTEPETLTPLLFITEKLSRGRTLKTKTSQRVIPIHTELVRLGFLGYVEDVRSRAGNDAWLFPLVAPAKGKARTSTWSRWFGRYLRAQGVTDTNKVFHSFRHRFKDEARTGRVEKEVHNALMGQADGTVGERYGAKEMLQRFGVKVLQEAVARIAYRGLDLSRVQPFVVVESTRKPPTSADPAWP
jgi:integrase